MDKELLEKQNKLMKDFIDECEYWYEFYDYLTIKGLLPDRFGFEEL